MKKLLALTLAWALAATPAFALYGGTVNQGGPAASGPWLVTPWISGAVNASGNPLFMQIVAGSAAIGTVSLTGTLPAYAATPTFNFGTLNGAATSANQSLNFQTTPVTPTIQNAAYAASNAIGALQTVSIFNTNGGTALLDQFSLTWAGTETVAVTVYLFARNPTATTCTDKAAFSLSTTDAKYLIVPPFVLVAAAPQGTTQTFANYLFAASTQNLDGTPGTNVYVCFVSGGAFTPAVGDLSFTIGGIKP